MEDINHLKNSDSNEVNVSESKNPENDISSGSEIQIALMKLKNHLISDKKFNRAVLILCNMIQQSLNLENNVFFYDCITELMSTSARDVLDAKYKSFYVDLFDIINSKKKYFSPQQQYRLASFNLYCHTRNKLLTDDSYLFVQEIKNVKEIVENETTYIENALDNSSSSTNIPSQEEVLERQKVLILTLEVACRNYRWSWAKQPIESIVQV